MLLLAENAKDHFTKLFLWNRMKEKGCTGFSLGRLHMGGICQPPPPPIYEGQNINGGLMRGGGHRPNFDRFRLYHKLKVLLMLYCNYMMQFIGFDSIKTHWFVSYCFQIRTVMQHQYKESGRQ